jgi:hypothetical protein
MLGSSGGHVRVAPQRDPPPEATGQREVSGSARTCRARLRVNVSAAPGGGAEELPTERARTGDALRHPTAADRAHRARIGRCRHERPRGREPDRCTSRPEDRLRVSLPAVLAPSVRPMRHVMQAGCWVLGAGCWVLGAGCWVLGAGCWVLGAGCWVLGAGCWVLGARCWFAGYRSSTPCRSCAAVSRRHPEGPARRCRASGCRSGTRTHREIAHAIAGAGLPVRRHAAG